MFASQYTNHGFQYFLVAIIFMLPMFLFALTLLRNSNEDDNVMYYVNTSTKDVDHDEYGYFENKDAIWAEYYAEQAEKLGYTYGDPQPFNHESELHMMFPGEFEHFIKEDK
jgi:hypothetical protein